MRTKEERMREHAGRLRQQLARIETALEVLSEYEDDPVEEVQSSEESDDVEDQRPGPTEAIRSLFEAEPQKQWRPVDLAIRLKVMLDNNELNTASLRDPVERTHTILRDLTKQGFIVKHQPVPKSHKSYYVKAVQEP